MFVFNIAPTAFIEMGSQLKVSSNRMVKPGIEPAIPGLQGEWFIHYTIMAPSVVCRPALKGFTGTKLICML